MCGDFGPGICDDELGSIFPLPPLILTCFKVGLILDAKKKINK